MNGANRTATTPSSARRARLLAALFAVAVVALTATRLLHDGDAGNLAYYFVTVGAAVVGWLGVARVKGPHGRAARWLAAGVASSGLAEALWWVITTLGFNADVSIADIFWLASYVLLGIGLMTLARRKDGPKVDVDGLIDMTIVAIVAFMVVGAWAVRNAVGDTSVSLLVRTVWGSYPVLDVALLALVARALIAGQLRSLGGLLLLIGTLNWLFADFAYPIAAASGTWSLWLEAGWMIGAATLAAGAYQLARTPERSRRKITSESDLRTGMGRIAITIVPLLVPGVIEVIAYQQGNNVHPVPLLLASLTIAALAFVRGARLVSARNRARAKVFSSARFYRAVAANSADAVVLADSDGRIIEDSPKFVDLLGWTGLQIKGRSLAGFLPDCDFTALPARVVTASEYRTHRPDKSEVWLDLRAVNLLDDPDVGAVVVNLHDITPRKRAEEALSHQALHDPLTGLANRLLFRDRVEHTLQRRVRTALDPAVIYLDLDGFKTINDSLGHECGDELLREVAARLLRAVRASDTVSRLGGDEFAILIEESPDVLAEAGSVADRILQVLSDPFELEGRQVTISASLGLAVADATSTASSLLRDSDVAMYRAKAGGKGRWVVHSHEMRAAVVERLEFENDLITALERDEFRLEYQPVMDLASNSLVGFEAFLRWHHPLRGVIEPGRFIPIAEDTGLIVAIGAWVLRTACVTAASWRRLSPETMQTMAVNVSARQLASPDLVDHVREALELAGLEPGVLVLEMTESMLIRDTAAVAERLHELRALGVKLAIDDFGTGYSSLSYLRQFPLDILKIDRSFINAIHDPAHVPAIVRGLLDLSRTLGLQTVAEGIESEVQRDQLRLEHCEFGQGFLFARPLAHDVAEQLLRDASGVVSAAT